MQMGNEGAMAPGGWEAESASEACGRGVDAAEAEDRQSARKGVCWARTGTRALTLAEREAQAANVREAWWWCW